MTRFVLRRLLEAVLALLSICVLIFFILHVGNMNPAHGLLGQLWTPKKGKALDAQLGLNHPVVVQFFLWLRGLFEVGGLGAIITQLLPPSLELLVLGAGVAFLGAIGMARLQMRNPGGRLDRVLAAVTGLISAVPGFFLGSVLLYLLAYRWMVFPAGSFTPPGHGILDWGFHQVLSVVTLALSVLGPWTRQLRASMGDVAASEYVRTARAKGASEARVISRHIMRNALLPLITMVGLSLPTLINTLIALEFIFGIHGAGIALISSLNALLFANATTVALTFAFVTVMGSLLSDLAYGLLDPRIEYR